MKKILIITIVSISLFSLYNCEDFSADSPSINAVTLVDYTVSATGTVSASFIFDCTADYVVVWWGDPDSDYAAYQEIISNPGSSEENITSDYPIGTALSSPDNWNGENTNAHAYPAVGNYTMVVIATNVGDFSEDIKTTMEEISLSF